MNYFDFEKICLSYGLTKLEAKYLSPVKYGDYNYSYNSNSPLWNRKEFANPHVLIKVEPHSRIVIYNEFFVDEHGAVFNGSAQFLFSSDEIENLTEEYLSNIIKTSIENFKNYEIKMKLNTIEKDF